MAREPTAAEALFGHLPRQSDVVVKQQDRNATLAETMYPELSQVDWGTRYWELVGLRKVEAKGRR